MNILKLTIKLSAIAYCCIFLYNTSAAQNINREIQNDFAMKMSRKILHIPDIPGYRTLKGDFHIHTIFSDGYVWPAFRVMEAWTEGLDVIAITDHIEYRPYASDLPINLNAGYERAIDKAHELNVLLIPGAEITKSTPPGHFNALFLDDVNKLVDNDPLIQIEEAIKQGAFILWNHPGWGWASPLPDTTKWGDFQTTILEKGWLHGVEVYNTEEWYQVALDWCNDKDLTVFANTDIHTSVNYQYDLTQFGSHRPMTLVFAKNRTFESVREALFSKRTLAFFDDVLAGNDELIKKLFHASTSLNPPFRKSERNGNIIYYAELVNHSDLTFKLEKEGDFKRNDRTDQVELLPQSITIINYTNDEKELLFKITNCYSDINTHPTIMIKNN